MFMCTQGAYYPTYLFIGFSALIILGDLFLGNDMSTNKYRYPILINLPIYINFPLLILFISIVVFLLGNHIPSWFINISNNYLHVDMLLIKESITLLDKISLIANCKFSRTTKSLIGGIILGSSSKASFKIESAK